ncbi:methyltransferase domain-containing protein [Chromohalobacter sarecensis]|uniref:Malonyl-[acyl-carrier protein] O-methyltransferase n=1 Tax=Chromohalobacter sarecensis TaxID=245294 RepID=A0ABV9D5B7_9GAMM|nr:methyltransferase domain-containing protein [Chromohalobacter sarecensis]MCK0713998.1 methyltransferase domain-containing protein [Chromohalobacter sarecensis]
MNTASTATERTDHAADWHARVAHAFSRAAPNYARRAKAQRAMAERLLERLPRHADNLLDLGCGPGDLTAELAQYYGENCTVSGLDLAPGMLAEARKRHGESAIWLCADAADLPLPSARFDLVVSNLAIQWCPDLDRVLNEIRRVLRPGGRALINTLGPGTLDEIGQAWGRPTALLEFRDADHHRRSAHGAGFRRVEVSAHTERFHYPDLSAVMASIKGVGAQVARAGARLSRADMARATRRYEHLRTDAGLPVSYHLLSLDLER